jgi:two-component system sensor histidine kinase MprB
MSFRLRLTVLAALAVAVAIVGTSVVVYYTDRHELIGQVDTDLSSTFDLPPLNSILASGFGAVSIKGPLPGRSVRVSGGMVSGAIPPGVFKVLLPRISTAVVEQVTRHKAGAAGAKTTMLTRFTTASVKGVPTRVLTLVLPSETVTVSRSLLEVDRNLSHLKWLLVFVSLGGIGAAAILGSLVSARAVAPLRRLTETTERIVETGDLSERTGRRGRDEISRLSNRLDELLASLEESLRTQRQLVADASHELRTPLTTLRANIGVLAGPGVLDAGEREGLLADVEDELEAMTTLVSELIELARGEEPDLASRAFSLDEVVRVAVDRAAKRAPTLTFRAELEPSVVTGTPERVERAVANLLDNASKWSPPDGTIDVQVRGALVEVRDHGPGIAVEDRPLVFNRFYRSKKARGMPGAGLGLAIVKQIADAHGGSVTVEEAPGGGTMVRMRLSPRP